MNLTNNNYCKFTMIKILNYACSFLLSIFLYWIDFQICFPQVWKFIFIIIDYYYNLLQLDICYIDYQNWELFFSRILQMPFVFYFSLQETSY